LNGRARTPVEARLARRLGPRVVAAALVLAAALLATGCGGGEKAETPSTVFGREARELAVGIAAQRRGETVDVETTVLARDGSPLSGLKVELAGERGPWAETDACGKGRYCGAFETTRPDPALRVRVTRPGGRASTVSARLPAEPEPARAARIVRDAARATRELRSVVVHERLGAGPPYPVLETRFTFVAPDRMTYEIDGAGQAVVVGRQRWDRTGEGAVWQRSQQDRLVVPSPAWRRAQHASLLGASELDGRDVWRVSFYDPTVPAWFEMDVDTETKLPLRLEMIGAAHFMEHDYRAFNAPFFVGPPVGAET
jgi:hypothetical protein